MTARLPERCFVLALCLTISIVALPSRASATDVVMTDDEIQAKILAEFEKRVAQERAKLLAELKKTLAETDRGRAAEIEQTEAKIAKLEEQAARLRKTVQELRAQLEKGGALAEKPAEIKPPAIAIVPADGGPFIGVRLAEVDAELAKKLGLEKGQGAQVVGAVPNTPAARIGLKANDVLTKVGGKDVTFETFSTAMAGRKPGDHVAIAYSRWVDGGPVRFDASLKLAARPAAVAEVPEQPTPTPPKPPVAIAPKPVKLGAGVRQLGEFDLEISRVQDGNNASIAGLEVGDKLLRLGGKKLKDLDQVISALGAIKAGDVADIVFKRGEATHHVKLKWAAEGGTATALNHAIAAPKPDAPRKPGFLGVGIQEGDHGLVIDEVVAGSCAELMGLKVQDRLVSINGKAVDNLDAAREALGGAFAGDRISITVMRGDVRYTLTGRLGERKDGGKHAAAGATKKAAETARAVGRGEVGQAKVARASAKVEAKRARPKAKGQLGVEVSVVGGHIIVNRVLDGSAAAKAGLEAGDTITRLGGKNLGSLDDLRAALDGKVVGDRLDCSIKRGKDKALEVGVELGAAKDHAPQASSRKPYVGFEVAEYQGGSLRVARVLDGGAAAAAGFAPGDVLLAIDDSVLSKLDDLRRVLGTHAAGDAIRCQVDRDGDRQELVVRLGAQQ